MDIGFFDGSGAELRNHLVAGYCLGASGLTVVLAAISAAGVI